jgi:hypothetical protein
MSDNNKKDEGVFYIYIYKNTEALIFNQPMPMYDDWRTYTFRPDECDRYRTTLKAIAAYPDVVATQGLFESREAARSALAAYEGKE